MDQDSISLRDYLNLNLRFCEEMEKTGMYIFGAKACRIRELLAGLPKD